MNIIASTAACPERREGKQSAAISRRLSESLVGSVFFTAKTRRAPRNLQKTCRRAKMPGWNPLIHANLREFFLRRKRLAKIRAD
jgi:hypothetical protein